MRVESRRNAALPRLSLFESCRKWFDELPEESGSEDIPHKESDTTNGPSSVRS